MKEQEDKKSQEVSLEYVNSLVQLSEADEKALIPLSIDLKDINFIFGNLYKKLVKNKKEYGILNHILISKGKMIGANSSSVFQIELIPMSANIFSDKEFILPWYFVDKLNNGASLFYSSKENILFLKKDNCYYKGIKLNKSSLAYKKIKKMKKEKGFLFKEVSTKEDIQVLRSENENDERYYLSSCPNSPLKMSDSDYQKIKDLHFSFAKIIVPNLLKTCPIPIPHLYLVLQNAKMQLLYLLQ